MVLRNQSNLVYSPHTYGPAVYMQEYFRDPRYPHNMPDIWETHFAFAEEWVLTVASKACTWLAGFGPLIS